MIWNLSPVRRLRLCSPRPSFRKPFRPTLQTLASRRAPSHVLPWHGNLTRNHQEEIHAQIL
jgi:hypothetical protein